MRVGRLLLGAVLLAGGCGDHSTPSSDAAPAPVPGTEAAVAVTHGARASARTIPPPSSGAAGVLGPDNIVVPPGMSTVTATFLPYTPGAAAITYDPAVVPPGATVELDSRASAGRMWVQLAVNGMIPRRTYGAHLHTAPCTGLPAAAGPHYQHEADPSTPSVDPAYANARNEVWLDFTADTQGAATAMATEGWTFDRAHRPRSLVVHAERTRTGKGVAGTAGARVACLTLPAG